MFNLGGRFEYGLDCMDLAYDQNRDDEPSDVEYADYDGIYLKINYRY